MVIKALLLDANYALTNGLYFVYSEVYIMGEESCQL